MEYDAGNFIYQFFFVFLLRYFFVNVELDEVQMIRLSFASFFSSAFSRNSTFFTKFYLFSQNVLSVNWFMAKNAASVLKINYKPFIVLHVAEQCKQIWDADDESIIGDEVW